MADKGHIVDNSILSEVARCQTAAAVRYVLHLQKKDEAVELRAGSDVHEALAVWLTSKGDTEKAMARLRERYQPYSKKHLQPGHRLHHKDVERVTQAWFDSHEHGRFVLVVKPADVEMALQAPLPIPGSEEQVVYVALLDALGARRVGGGRYSVDHKTGRALTDYWIGKQKHASQFTGQMWLAQEMGRPIQGVFVNGIEYPQLNSSDRKCFKHGVKYKECAVSHARTHLFPVTRTAGEIAAWLRTAVMLTKRLLKLKEKVKTIEDAGKLPMEGRFNGSCGFCALQDWCALGRPARGLVGTFVEEEWNPLEHAQRRGGVKK